MKRKLENQNNSTPKKKNWLPLSEKLEIIKRHENGASYAKISRDKEVPESTIRRLVKNKDELRKQSINSPSQNAKLATRIRSRAMEKMEHLLSIWIEHNVQNSIPMSLNCIKSEALILYEKVKSELCDKSENEVNETFVASTGWFDRFRNRIGLKNVVINGEASSADEDAAKSYPIEFQKMIHDEGYCESQLFNFDETGLFYRKMPTRSYITADQKAMKGTQFPANTRN